MPSRSSRQARQWPRPLRTARGWLHALREADQWRRTLRERGWLVAVAAFAVAVQLWALARVLPGRQPPPLGDSVIFEYHGWRLANGARLYVDLWEVKPPLSYQTTAALSLLAGGDQLLYHYLAVALTNVAVVGVVVLVAVLAAEVTGDHRAGIVAALAVYASPVLFMRATYGFKSKYFVLLSGLAAIYLLLRDRPFAGGVAAAAAVGYWQLGVVFPLVAVGLAVQRGGRRGFVRVAAGGATMAALTLGPVVARGGLVPMLAQTVLAPLLVGGSQPLVRRLDWIVTLFPIAPFVLVPGLAGAVLAVATDRRHWWVTLLWGWFTGHLLFVNFDFYADLIPAVIVNGLAVGVLVGHLLAAAPVAALPRAPWTDGLATSASFTPFAEWRLPLHPGVPVAGLVAAVLVVNVAALGGVAGMDPHPVKETGNVSATEEVSPPYLRDEKRALLFRGMEAETCHVFTGRRQRAWIDLTNGSRDAAVCDRLPPGYGWLAALGPANTTQEAAASGGSVGPDETSTPYPTLTPRPLVIVGELQYRWDEETLVVTVPLSNDVDRGIEATVVLAVTVDGASVERRRQLTLSGGEERTVVFRIDAGGGTLTSLAVEVEEGATEG